MLAARFTNLMLMILLTVCGVMNVACLGGDDQPFFHAAAEHMPAPESDEKDENAGQASDGGEEIAERSPGIPELTLKMSKLASGSDVNLINRVFFLTPLRPPSL